METKLQEEALSYYTQIENIVNNYFKLFTTDCLLTMEKEKVRTVLNEIIAVNGLDMKEVTIEELQDATYNLASVVKTATIETWFELFNEFHDSSPILLDSYKQQNPTCTIQKSDVENEMIKIERLKKASERSLSLLPTILGATNFVSITKMMEKLCQSNNEKIEEILKEQISDLNNVTQLINENMSKVEAEEDSVEYKDIPVMTPEEAGLLDNMATEEETDEEETNEDDTDSNDTDKTEVKETEKTEEATQEETEKEDVSNNDKKPIELTWLTEKENKVVECYKAMLEVLKVYFSCFAFNSIYHITNGDLLILLNEIIELKQTKEQETINTLTMQELKKSMTWEKIVSILTFKSVETWFQLFLENDKKSLAILLKYRQKQSPVCTVTKQKIKTAIIKMQHPQIYEKALETTLYSMDMQKELLELILRTNYKEIEEVLIELCSTDNMAGYQNVQKMVYVFHDKMTEINSLKEQIYEEREEADNQNTEEENSIEELKEEVSCITSSLETIQQQIDSATQSLDAIQQKNKEQQQIEEIKEEVQELKESIETLPEKIAQEFFNQLGETLRDYASDRYGFNNTGMIWLQEIVKKCREYDG